MSVESSSPDRPSTAETLIVELGRTDASGVLELRHPSGVPSYVWVRGGRVYAMQVPGYRPALGIRLLSGGLVSPEQLSAAAAEQRERRPGQLIGEVLVGMGYVSTDVIDAFVRQQVIDQIGDLLDLEIAAAEFHVGRHIRQGMTEPSDVEELLQTAHECRARRTAVLERVGGPSAVPVLGPSQGGPSRTPLGPYDWALLCRVDGTRDLTELARVCGFTVVEAAQVVADLTRSGLLALPAPGQPDDSGPLAPVVSLRSETAAPDPQWRFDGTDAGEPDPVQDPRGSSDADAARGALMAEFGALLRNDSDGPSASAPDQQDVAHTGDAEVLLAPTESGAVPPVLQPEAREHVAAPHTETVAPAGQESAPLTGGSATIPATADVTSDAPAPAVPEPVAPMAVAPEPSGSPTDAASGAAPEAAESDLCLVRTQAPRGLSIVADSPRPPLTVVQEGFEPESPTPADDSGPETTAFMRELSSLSDDPDRAEPEVRRLVVPLREHRRRRRPWRR